MKYQLKILIPFFIFIMVLINCLSKTNVSGATTCSLPYDIDNTNSNSHFKSNRIHLNINPGIELNVKKITFNASFYIITLNIKRKPEDNSIFMKHLNILYKKLYGSAKHNNKNIYFIKNSKELTK